MEPSQTALEINETYVKAVEHTACNAKEKAYYCATLSVPP